MTEELPPENHTPDLIFDHEDADLAPLNEMIDQMQPNMPLGERYGNARLYRALRRAFEAIGDDLTDIVDFVDLGAGDDPYQPTVRLVYDPTNQFAIDTEGEVLASIRTRYPGLPTEGKGSVQTIEHDATNPEDVPGFGQGRKVDAVAMFHPNIADIAKGDASGEDKLIPSEATLTQARNWLQRLAPGRFMVITTHHPDEAEAFMNDATLESHAVLYGVTDLVEPTTQVAHMYLIVLGQAQRSIDQEPIVWRVEDYEDYDPDEAFHYYGNMFSDDYENDDGDEDYDDEELV